MVENKIFLAEVPSVFWILLFSFLLSLILCSVQILSSRFLSPSRNFEQKFTAYECGFDPFDDARMRFDVRYYLVAILFLLFDVELVYLLPWAVFLPVLTTFSFWTMELFMLIVTVGFIFEYSVKALNWQSV